MHSCTQKNINKSELSLHTHNFRNMLSDQIALKKNFFLIAKQSLITQRCNLSHSIFHPIPTSLLDHALVATVA